MSDMHDDITRRLPDGDKASRRAERDRDAGPEDANDPDGYYLRYELTNLKSDEGSASSKSDMPDLEDSGADKLDMPERSNFEEIKVTAKADDVDPDGIKLDTPEPDSNYEEIKWTVKADSPEGAHGVVLGQDGNDLLATSEPVVDAFMKMDDIPGESAKVKDDEAAAEPAQGWKVEEGEAGIRVEKEDIPAFFRDESEDKGWKVEAGETVPDPFVDQEKIEMKLDAAADQESGLKMDAAADQKFDMKAELAMDAASPELAVVDDPVGDALGDWSGDDPIVTDLPEPDALTDGLDDGLDDGGL